MAKFFPGGSSEGGASAFTELSDAPQAYSDVVLTDVLTPNNVYLGDNQKVVAVGADGFVRFLYMDGNDLHFVHCLDAAGSTFTDEIVATHVDGIDSSVLRIGSDGFARVAYINYATPNELRYIVFNNADGTDVDDVLIATSAGGFYEIALAITSDDIPYIVFNDFDDDKVKMAVCSDSAGTVDDVVDITNATAESNVSIQMASDDTPRLAYVGNDSDQTIHFVICNAAGTVTTDSAMTDAASAGNKYYLELALWNPSSFAFPYIAVGVTGYGLALFIGSNDQGSSYAVVLLDADADDCQPSIVMAPDDVDFGYPRIAYVKSDVLHYIRTTDQFASEAARHIAEVGPSQDTEVQMAMGLDGLARIIYSRDNTVLSLARLTGQNGDASKAGQLVKVNDDNDGLEFGFPPFSSLTDVPGSYTEQGLKNVRVKQDETGLEFDLPPGFGALSNPAVGDPVALSETPSVLKLILGEDSYSEAKLTITAPGNYLIFARVKLDYNGATFAANRNITLKIRRTNNTAEDIQYMTTLIKTPIITTQTYTAGIFMLPISSYFTLDDQVDHDVLEVWGSIDTGPTAGAVDVSDVEIFALKLY